MKEKIRIKGITSRWITNTLGIVIVIFIGIMIVATLFLRSYYYNTVRRTLNIRSGDAAISFFSAYTGGTKERFLLGAREFTDSFSHGDTMVVWVLDEQGVVVASSTGFMVETPKDMPDYEEAKQNHLAEQIKTTKMPSGESIMAKTLMLRSDDGQINYGAVRYIISLDSINNQMVVMGVLMVLASLFATLFLAISGLFFIRSIVFPVQSINKTAKQIASGDMHARIDIPVKDDEIGELCHTINEMAEELSETETIKNDFISTVSHELRTPLTAIKGWGETIREVGSEDSEIMQKGLDIIIDEAGRLSDIVNDLLDFSRIENGRFTLKKAKMNIISELEQSMLMFKERAQREGKEFIYNVPEEIIIILGDANRIRQVLINVLDNAFKYTKREEMIAISAQRKKDQIIIRIADTGRGIPKEALPKIKEKFYKANVVEKGSGIGLAVAEEIISLHGGEIAIESVENSGTTIFITLPIDIESVEDDVPDFISETILLPDFEGDIDETKRN